MTLPLNAPWCRLVCVIPGGAAYQHQKLGHGPFPGRILTGTSTRQLGRGRGQAVPCPPGSPRFLTRHTTKWIPSDLCSRDPGSSYQSIGCLCTNSRATAEPYSEAMQHPEISNYAALAKQDEKLTRSDPIILGCKCTTPLLQTSDLDSMA